MTWLYINIAILVIDGFYQGLIGRFGPNILTGYRRYRAGFEPDFIGLEHSSEQRKYPVLRLPPPEYSQRLALSHSSEPAEIPHSE